jgi:hypothetical protein
MIAAAQHKKKWRQPLRQAIVSMAYGNYVPPHISKYGKNAANTRHQCNKTLWVTGRPDA